MFNRFAKAHATDTNQPEIIEALEEIGCVVYEIEKPVDLLIEFKRLWILIEVKNPKGRNRLTKEQVKFFKKTRAASYVVRNPIEAKAAIRQAFRENKTQSSLL